ncbi:tetratricopeptide repeat protein [candidate division WOR-3 bacterium]|nr:tetratricopeptide repeat protein [candidate division WOR-3 bacterium]
MSELGEVKRKVAEFEASGDEKKAVAELEKAIQDFPKEGSLFNKLGDLYIKIDHQADALRIYERGAKVFKEETYYPNAIALCKKILRLSKNQVDVYGILGELHKELDQRGEAANYFLEYADRKMKENDLESALNAYKTIRELVPGNPKILETISAIYEKVGKKEEGAELLKEAHEIEDRQEKLRETIGAEEIVEVREKAIKDIVEESIEEEKEESETDVDIDEIVSPEIAKLLKDDDRAVTDEEIITEESPEELSEIDKTIELGKLYLNLGSEEEAIDCFRSAADEVWKMKDYDTALSLNKKIAGLRPFDLRSRQHLVEIAKIKDDKELLIDSMLDLAESLNRREAKTEARDLYKKILTIDSGNTIANEMLAAFEQPKDFVDLGEVLRTELAGEKKTDGFQNIEDLVSQFRREVFESIGEGDFHSRYDLGVAYKGMGLYQEAIEEFEIAAKDEELKFKALEMIGSCFLERGKIEDAIKVLNEGLKVTNHPRREYFGIHFLLGNCYEKKNKLKEALQCYYNAYKIDKTMPELTKKINKFTAILKKKVKRTTIERLQQKKPDLKSVSTTRKVKTKKSKITYL